MRDLAHRRSDCTAPGTGRRACAHRAALQLREPVVDSPVCAHRCSMIPSHQRRRRPPLRAVGHAPNSKTRGPARPRPHEPWRALLRAHRCRLRPLASARLPRSSRRGTMPPAIRARPAMPARLCPSSTYGALRRPPLRCSFNAIARATCRDTGERRYEHGHQAERSVSRRPGGHDRVRRLGQRSRPLPWVSADSLSAMRSENAAGGGAISERRAWSSSIPTVSQCAGRALFLGEGGRTSPAPDSLSRLFIGNHLGRRSRRAQPRWCWSRP